MTDALDLQRLRGLAVSETGVLFDPASGNTFTMNRVATSILHALQRGLAPDRVCDVLKEEYEINPQTLERDMREFLDRLKTLGLT